MTAPGEIRYARSRDGIDIAFMEMGDGPPVVQVSGFISHLDLMWDIPPLSTWARRLADHCRLLLFDKRGTGLSDRSLGHGSLEDRMDDLRAVMDAAGYESAAFACVSEGGPLAMLFAATYPERVSRLLLFGTFARISWAEDYPTGIAPELAEQFNSSVEAAWGTGRVVGSFLGGGDRLSEETRSLLARYERNACTPQLAASILRLNVEIDIRPLVPTISVPTLVMHHRGDPLIGVEGGRYLAQNIPGARLIEYDGDVHFGFDPATISEEAADAAAFLTGDVEKTQLRSERFLSTVMFTDIVGSTGQASDMGDARWNELLDQHDAATDQAVRRFDGRIVKRTGDGVMATFDGPSRALDCARAIQSAVGAMGLRVRAGVHTGEVERRGEDIGGLGVHIAARVADLADAGEIFATRTVRDLTAGSGLEFSERGRHVLKGVPDEWELYSLSG